MARKVNSVMKVKGITVCDPDYEVVAFPDSQIIESKEGFLENCSLINSDSGIKEFGSGAYKVDKDWLEKVNAGEIPDKEYTEDEMLLLDCDYDTDWFKGFIDEDEYETVENDEPW